MRGSWNSRSIILITLYFLFFFIFNFQEVFSAPTTHLCHPVQRDALLEFKNEFASKKPCFDNLRPKTDSWEKNSDCCYWDGIQCDEKSGEVIELILTYSCLHGQFHSNSSLFGLQNLRFLTTLDLSQNNFSGLIPSSIGNFSRLTTLDLSRNYFSGWITFSIGYLSHLTSLDLSFNLLSGCIPSSIGNISHLKTIYLSYNSFTFQIPSSVGNLADLTSLHLAGNDFFGEIPSSIGNLSHLTSLSLFSNNFAGEIPSSFGSLNQLTNLDVGSNKLSGIFPITLLNLTKLSFLALSKNQLTGTLSLNISSLFNLVSFDASGNSFVGTFPSYLLKIPSLTNIDLSNNQLNDTLEFGNISSPSNLQVLGLGNNNLRGPIPRSISRLVNLLRLDLSHFNIQGPIDFSIFSPLNSLQYLSLSYLNNITTIDLNSIFSCFKSLFSLDLSGNHISAANMNANSHPPSLLISNLYLSGCSITEFPEVLRTQHEMGFLDISNNKLKGQVPSWLWTLPQLVYVNLSNNTFTGFEISKKRRLSADPKPSLEYLSGSNNNFSGKIPSFICGLRSLSTLDLSKNNFNGSIPRCMGNLNHTLSVLNLRQNRLSGSLPETIFESLKSLDVSHNQLVGKLPRSLIHSSTLEVLNVESNKINDTFPSWLSSLPELQVLVLRSNVFHGPIHQTGFPMLRIIDISHNHFSGTLPSHYFLSWSAISSLVIKEERSNEKYMGDGYYSDSMVLMNKGVAMELVRILRIYTALDSSGNKFEGEIPMSIGLLKELHVLNLSNNGFTGHIPISMGNLTALESLDVSQNKLSGEIPQELGNLSYLAYMNFSHNQLEGLVPGGTQFRTQPCSSFKDNLGLFGPSLDEVCKDIHAPAPQPSETLEPEDDEEEAVLSWLAAGIGLGPGIVLGLTIGYILASYKPEWFMNPFRRNKRKSTTAR